MMCRLVRNHDLAGKKSVAFGTWVCGVNVGEKNLLFCTAWLMSWSGTITFVRLLGPSNCEGLFAQ